MSPILHGANRWLVRHPVARALVVFVVVVSYPYFTRANSLHDWFVEQDPVASVVSGVAIILAAARYFILKQRNDEVERKSLHYRAWSTISNAVGKPGDAGRFLALTELSRDGVNLDGVNLDGAHLAGLVLLPGTSMRFAKLRHVESIGIDLTNSVLNGVVFHKSDIHHASLRGAKLDGAKLHGTSFVGVNASGASMRSVRLSRASFKHSVLRRVDMSSAVGAAVGFYDTTLEGAVIHRASFKTSTFEMGTLRDAVCANTKFSACDWKKIDLSGTKFTFCKLTRNTFENCDLTGVDFQGSNLSGTKFNDCRLDDATFVNAKLAHVAFEGCSMYRTVFVGAIGAAEAEWHSTTTFKNSNLQKARVTPELRVQMANSGGVDVPEASARLVP